MASYLGVRGALRALERHLQHRLPAGWRADALEPTMNPPPRVELLGSSALAGSLSGNLLGLYPYRLVVDAHGRNRPLTVPGPNGVITHAELPVNLQLLVIANGTSAQYELDLLAWAMIELANHSQLDAADLDEGDPHWGRQEALAIQPTDLSNEDLMRLWDQFEADYTLAVPYEIRTVRLRLTPEDSEGPAVGTRAFPLGTLEEHR